MTKWTKHNRRTPDGHKFVVSVQAGLKAHGWSQNNPKAVRLVIAELRENNLENALDSEDTLRVNYYRTACLPPPRPTEEDRRRAHLRRWRKQKNRWMSLLIQWGKATKRHPAIITAKQAHEIVNRLFAVTPQHRRVDLDHLFTHMSIHRTGREKIKWIQSAIARLEANPNDWPIPISRRGRPDVTAGRIETYLANAPGKRAHKSDIVIALKIPRTTAQTTLRSLERARRIDRVANGVYGLPAQGVSPYIPGDRAVLHALRDGRQRSCAELRTETGKSVGAVSAALHRLHKAGSIVLINRGRYALPGCARPHVYARDAIRDALRSGKKAMTMPELMGATGKKYGEIWQALRRDEAKGRVTQVARRGRPAWRLSRSD